MDIAPAKPPEYVPPLVDPSSHADVAKTGVQREPLGDREAAALAGLLRLLGDRTRLGLLLLLADGEQTVTRLCARMRIPQPTISHHLAWLRTSRLVVARRSGKNVFYSHGPAVVADGNWLTVATVRIRFRADAA